MRTTLDRTLTPWRLPFLNADAGSGGGNAGSGNGGASAGGESDGPGNDGPDGGGNRDEDPASKMRTALDKERENHKATRQTVTDLQAKVDELEGATKTDMERLTGERDALQGKLDAATATARDATGRAAVLDAAREAGATNARAVYALAAPNLDYDKDHKPTNVDTVIDAVKEAEPDLFRHSDGNADAGDGGTPPNPNANDMNARLRAAFKR